MILLPNSMHQRSLASKQRYDDEKEVKRKNFCGLHRKRYEDPRTCLGQRKKGGTKEFHIHRERESEREREKQTKGNGERSRRRSGAKESQWRVRWMQMPCDEIVLWLAGHEAG